MSKPIVIKKHARIGSVSTITKRDTPPVMEVWGLKNWLLSLKLTGYYSFFRNLDFDQIISITEREVYTKLSPELVYKVIDSMDVVKAQQKLILDVKRHLLGGKCVHQALVELGRVLPSQFEALLGRISILFVEAMQLVYFRIHSLKPPSFKRDCQTLFYKYCLRGELCDSFMVGDKDMLRKWRLAYQQERKLAKQNQQIKVKKNFK